MIGAGIGLMVIGYAFAYSGISNITTGGHGWGFIRALVNRGGNTSTDAMASFVQGIKPQGNTGADRPSNDSPVKGSQPV